jgi:hypothetical protein
MEINEANADGITNLEDFKKKYPGKVEEVKHWFTVIKTYDGKPANTYMEGVDYFDQKESM